MKRFYPVLCIALLGSVHAFGKVKPIDTEHSSFAIHVGKSGLFSVAGHDHEVVAPIAEGIVDDAEPGHILLRIEAAKLTVLPEQDQAAVQSTMQSQVLERKSFPEIRFESTSIAKVSDGKWASTGNLTLHGQTKVITVQVQREKDGYTGRTTIKQTQFGIQPVSAAGGAIKVKDELQIEFVIVARFLRPALRQNP
jgi:polyisoprenoid-binding protein YceI